MINAVRDGVSVVFVAQVSMLFATDDSSPLTMAIS
jgi:hypothetical protein